MSEPTIPARFRGHFAGYVAPTEARLKAQAEGSRALMDGQSPAQNPYRHDRSPRGQLLGLMWMRGWRTQQDLVQHHQEGAGIDE